MSLELLLALQEAHAFDHAPLRHDLGVYHVPFGELTTVTSPEDRLAGAAQRGESTVVVGRPGSGKSSLIEHVLGPASRHVAPILIPVSGEPPDLAASVQGVAGLIVQTIVDQSDLSTRESGTALEGAAATRQLTAPSRTTGLSLGGSWMGAKLSAEVKRQVPPSLELPRTAQSTLEVVDRLLELIQQDDLIPLLVFDDTDRWFRGGGDEHRDVARAFFSRVLPELRQRPAGMVLAAQTSYFADEELAGILRSTIENRIDIPALTSKGALGRILASRIEAHTDEGATLESVVDSAALDRLYGLYAGEFDGALRDVIRTMHVALTEACDNRFPRVTVELIDQAAAW